MTSVTSILIGFVLAIFCLAMAVSLDLFFTTIPTATLELYQIALLILGVVCFFIGVVND